MARRKPFLLLLVLGLSLVFNGPTVKADMTADDTFYGGNDILYYDADFTGTCTTASAGGSVTNDKGNVPNAYNFLVKKGLTGLQASAVVGNLKQESGVRPTARNPNGGAYGIAQWLGGRLTNLQKKANYKTLATQLDYLWEELNGDENAALKALKAYSGDDPKELAVKFGETFERYGSGEEGNRAKYAAEVFEQYGGGGATTGANDACDNVGNGNFVYYAQEDPKWANTAYGSGKIGPDGCGPTSLAMIVATLFDKKATPATIAKIGDSNGSFIDGVGTSHQKLLKPVSEKYGFTYDDLTLASINVLEDVVKDGGLVYMAGSGAAPFTSGGHIVVMRGVTKDGDIIIADPYRGKTDTYTVNQIEAGRGSTFGIKKS